MKQTVLWSRFSFSYTGSDGVIHFWFIVYTCQSHTWLYDYISHTLLIHHMCWECIKNISYWQCAELIIIHVGSALFKGRRLMRICSGEFYNTLLIHCWYIPHTYYSFIYNIHCCYVMDTLSCIVEMIYFMFFCFCCNSWIQIIFDTLHEHFQNFSHTLLIHYSFSLILPPQILTNNKWYIPNTLLIRYCRNDIFYVFCFCCNSWIQIIADTLHDHFQNFSHTLLIHYNFSLILSP